jgi:hypothetical protein
MIFLSRSHSKCMLMADFLGCRETVESADIPVFQGLEDVEEQLKGILIVQRQVINPVCVESNYRHLGKAIGDLEEQREQSQELTEHISLFASHRLQATDIGNVQQVALAETFNLKKIEQV